MAQSLWKQYKLDEELPSQLAISLYIYIYPKNMKVYTSTDTVHPCLWWLCFYEQKLESNPGVQTMVAKIYKYALENYSALSTEIRF